MTQKTRYRFRTQKENHMPDETGKFIDWLSSAKKGDHYIYAHNTPHLRAACSGELANSVYAAQLSGHVHLVQKRLRYPASEKGLGAFDYIAIRTQLDTL